jgi:hypothetical protein
LTAVAAEVAMPAAVAAITKRAAVHHEPCSR